MKNQNSFYVLMLSLLLTTSFIGCGGEPEAESVSGTCNYTDGVCRVATPDGTSHTYTINNNRITLQTDDEDDTGRFVLLSDETRTQIEAAQAEHTGDDGSLNEEAFSQALAEINIWVMVAVEENERLTNVRMGALHLESVQALWTAFNATDDEAKVMTSIRLTENYSAELEEEVEEADNGNGE